jgi:hypothetical protein
MMLKVKLLRINSMTFWCECEMTKWVKNEVIDPTQNDWRQISSLKTRKMLSETLNMDAM